MQDVCAATAAEKMADAEEAGYNQPNAVAPLANRRRSTKMPPRSTVSAASATMSKRNPREQQETRKNRIEDEELIPVTVLTARQEWTGQQHPAQEEVLPFSLIPAYH